MNFLSNGIEKLTKIVYLNLNLYKNHIKNNGAKFLSNAIEKLIKITSLTFDLGVNNIEEINSLSNSIENLT